MKTDPRIRFQTPVLLAAMLSLSGIATSALADRAENAFVVVEGDGVVRLDGKNFAVLGGCSGEETEVTVKPQPGWVLLTPSRIKAKAGSPVPFKVRSKSMEEIVDGKMTRIDIELTAYDCLHDSGGKAIPWNAKAEGPIPEDEEESPGAFIHWNIDNDDMSSGGTAKHPGMDATQIGPIPNEDDLKMLKCELLPENLSVGIATLRLDSSNGVLWKGRGKGRHNLVVPPNGSRSWNLADSTERQEFRTVIKRLFVEGVGSGTCSVSFEYSMNEESISDVANYTFIAADCGNQPTREQKNLVLGLSANKLEGCEWSISDATFMNCNCLALSVGKTNTRINLVKMEGTIANDYVDGRIGVPDGKVTIKEICAFYEDCEFYRVHSISDADVVFYGSFDGMPDDAVNPSLFHAASRKSLRQPCDCGNGIWDMFESKLGNGQLVEHRNVDHFYRPAILYFKKRGPQEN